MVPSVNDRSGGKHDVPAIMSLAIDRLSGFGLGVASLVRFVENDLVEDPLQDFRDEPRLKQTIP